MTEPQLEAARTALSGWELRLVDEGAVYRGKVGAILVVEAPAPALARRLFRVFATAATVVVGVLLVMARWLPFFLLGAPAALVGLIGLARAIRDVFFPRSPFELRLSRHSAEVRDERGARRTGVPETFAVTRRRVSGGIEQVSVVALGGTQELFSVGPLEPAQGAALEVLLVAHLGIPGGTVGSWAQPIA